MERTDVMGINVDLLRKSYAVLAVRIDRLTERLFEILFSKNPSLELLFSETDIPSLRKMLRRVLALFMRHVDRIDQLEPYLLRLGRNHSHFGVQPEHFSHFQEALLEAMAEVAPEVWSKETELAWDELLGVVSAIMQQALVDCYATKV